MADRFEGFPEAALDFLRGLAANNEASLFKPRKAIYEAKVRTPMSLLIAALAELLPAHGLPLAGDPPRSMFRIYRDIRFSRDKRPYKPMASAALTRSGERMDPGVLYIHVEPGKSFLGCGFWQPLPQLLEAWRREMIRKPLAFLSVLRAIEAKGHSLESGELRKRLPRGFETASGTAIAPYLLWNSFISRREIPDDELQSAELPQRILTFAQASRPLLDYGWALMPGGSASVRDDANPRDVKPERRRASSRK